MGPLTLPSCSDFSRWPLLTWWWRGPCPGRSGTPGSRRGGTERWSHLFRPTSGRCRRSCRWSRWPWGLWSCWPFAFRRSTRKVSEKKQTTHPAAFVKPQSHKSQENCNPSLWFSQEGVMRKTWDLPQVVPVEMQPLQLHVGVPIEQRHVSTSPLNHCKNNGRHTGLILDCCLLRLNWNPGYSGYLLRNLSASWKKK